MCTASINLSADPQQEVQDYILAHYDIHYNQLTSLTEFREKGSLHPFVVADKREVNSLLLDLHEQGLDCTETDLKRLLNSDRILDFHPMLHYMAHLPEWDGIDRVTPLAQRISKSLVWQNGFHRWMLGMVAQFMGRSTQCANSLVPILVSSEQGLGKSTFCRSILPPELTRYYSDSVDVTTNKHTEQLMGTLALINLDEFDRISERNMARLKNVLQMKTCTFRRLYSNQFLILPRMASVIGTSNSNQLLYDPSGSRRFPCVTVESAIDNSPIQHPQLYAQLKAELLRGERCYLTRDEEREIEENNQNYYHLNPEADLFLKYFAVPRADDSYQELTAADIFTHLQRRNPVALRGCNANSFGHTLLQLGVERHHTDKGNLYRVKVV